MKKILILTHQFPPTNIVGALRPYRLAKHIGNQGWQPIIITKCPDDQSALDISLLDDLSPTTIIYYLNKSTPFLIQKNCSENYKKYYNQQKNCLKKIAKKKWVARAIGSIRDATNKLLIPDVDISVVPAFIAKIKRILKDLQADVAFTTSPSHSVHLAGLRVKQTRKIPWIADFRDPWDHYPKTGNTRLTNPFERWLEEKILTKADAVISTSTTYTENLRRNHKDLNSEKFYTITNTYSEEKGLSNTRKDPEKFIISYTGIFYPEKDPFTFFRALRSWFDILDEEEEKKYVNRLKIQLIGSKNSFVESIIKDLKLEDVVSFIDRVPHREAIRLTQGSDMLLLATGLGNRTRPGWLPSKLYEYLGSRIPILAVTKDGEAARIIRQTNSGYIVNSEDHDKIHRILCDEIEKKFSDESSTKKIKFTFEGIERYEEKNVMQKMISIIENTAQRHG